MPVDETRQLRFNLLGSLRGLQEQIGMEVYAKPALADVYSDARKSKLQMRSDFFKFLNTPEILWVLPPNESVRPIGSLSPKYFRAIASVRTMEFGSWSAV